MRSFFFYAGFNSEVLGVAFKDADDLYGEIAEAQRLACKIDAA